MDRVPHTRELLRVSSGFFVAPRARARAATRVCLALPTLRALCPRLDGRVPSTASTLALAMQVRKWVSAPL